MSIITWIHHFISDVQSCCVGVLLLQGLCETLGVIRQEFYVKIQETSQHISKMGFK